MKYDNVIKGKFISRPNRFIAKVDIDGKEETVHVKNTGRCRELLTPGAVVALQHSDNPNRKTKYDLIAVIKPNLGWVNIDSQVTNKIVYEWLLTQPEEFSDITFIKPEYKFGNSRIDFYLEAKNEDGSFKRKILLEVKGCTLEIDGNGYFPDAPTKRGVRHLGELADAIDQGYEAYILYCIAMEHVNIVYPNAKTAPDYEKAFYEAVQKGVTPIYLACKVESDSIYAI